MRMRDLEKVSGVSRETIRFYIREGLLPEPVKTSRNSAVYDEEHLARLFAIRRLRGDRYLPLSVIRSLLETSQAEGSAPAELLHDVDRYLQARLQPEGVRESAAAVAAEYSDDPDHLAECIDAGLIEVAKDGTISPRDARILRIVNEIAALGFTRKSGYTGDISARYVELMRWLAREEVRDFLANSAARLSREQASDMAARVVPLLNTLLGELHVREILGALAEGDTVWKTANDNSGDDALPEQPAGGSPGPVPC